MAGGLVRPVSEQGDIGFQHLLLFGPQFFLQDLFKTPLEFLLRHNPHFFVDQAQDGGPGEVPVEVHKRRLGAVQSQELDLPVFNQSLDLGREGGDDVVAALGGVDDQQAVFLEAAHVFP